MRLTFFDPGQLRQAMTLEAPTETPDGMGGFVVTWSETGFVWGHVSVASHRIENIASRQLNEATHTVTIRFRDGVNDSQRFNANGRFYRILSVEDVDGTRRYLACKVREERP